MTKKHFSEKPLFQERKLLQLSCDPESQHKQRVAK
jgi:hypothetical protein